MESFESGPKLTKTDAATLEALEARIREVANIAGMPGDNISEKDITQAAFHAALAAERDGNPYTEKVIDAMTQDDMLTLVESLGLRLEARPGEDVEERRAA